MGFFTDLKEDLSQAVNELMPEEEAAENQETDALEETVDLEAMLNHIEETAPETVTTAEAAAETELEPKPEAVTYTEPVIKEKPARTEYASRPAPSVPVFHQNSGELSDETAVITLGMTITGDIQTQGSIELSGNINGNINALGKLNISGVIQGNSKAAEIYAEGAKIIGEVVSEGSVKIGQSTVIIGNISATSAVIAGAIKGDIDVKGPVILDTSAIVMGNIKSKSVQINNGAVIEGLCSQCYADVNPTSFFDEFKKMSKK